MNPLLGPGSNLSRQICLNSLEVTLWAPLKFATGDELAPCFAQPHPDQTRQHNCVRIVSISLCQADDILPETSLLGW